jgi:hypothetical protein
MVWPRSDDFWFAAPVAIPVLLLGTALAVVASLRLLRVRRICRHLCQGEIAGSRSLRSRFVWLGPVLGGIVLVWCGFLWSRYHQARATALDPEHTAWWTNATIDQGFALTNAFVWIGPTLAVVLVAFAIELVARSELASLGRARELAATLPDGFESPAVRAWLRHPGPRLAPILGAVGLVVIGGILPFACAGSNLVGWGRCALSRNCPGVPIEAHFDPGFRDAVFGRATPWFTAAAWSFGVCVLAAVVLVAWAVRASARARERNCPGLVSVPLAPRRCWVVTGCSLVGAVGLWLLGEPLRAEAAAPIPSGYAWYCGCLCLHPPDPPEGRGPDLPREGPQLTLGRQMILLDMGPIDLERFSRVLASIRESWEKEHGREVFPGHLSLSVDRDVTIDRVRAALEQMERAGYHEIDAMLSEHVTLHRPVLGVRTGVRYSAIRFRVGTSPADTVVDLEGIKTWGEFLQRIGVIREQGKVPLVIAR